MNDWDVLGIERTDDQRAIKRAYARKSREVHPEEHPEEFQLLHEAYENALRYAKNRTPVPNGVMEPTPRKEEPTLPHEPVVEETRKDEPRPLVVSEPNEEEKSELKSDVIDFDEILERDAISYFEKVQQLAKQSVDELEQLYTSKVKKYKAWDAVCKSSDFCEVGLHPFFIDQITAFVRERPDLPKNAYKALSKVYRIEGLTDREDKGYLSELYGILEERKQIPNGKKQSKSAWAGIISALALSLSSLSRSDGNFAMVLGAICAILLLIAGVAAMVYTIRHRKDRPNPPKEENPMEHRTSDWNPVHHIKGMQYYAKGVPLAWIFFLLVSVFWIVNYEETFSILMGVFTMIVSVANLAVVLLVNLILFGKGRWTHHKPKSASTKKGFLTALVADIWCLFLNLYMMLGETLSETTFDIWGVFLFGVPILYLVIRSMVQKRKKNEGE